MLFSIENTKHLSLAIALIGFTALIILLPNERVILIEEITPGNSGEIVITNGAIRNLQIKNNNVFFELENNGRIKAVYFSPKTEQLMEIRENKIVKVKGKIALYKGELEIILREVKIID